MINSTLEIRSILDKNAWEVFKEDAFVATVYRLPEQSWVSFHTGIKLTTFELRHLDEFLRTISGHYVHS